jgi:vancomycin resistance protein YoaR
MLHRTTIVVALIVANLLVFLPVGGLGLVRVEDKVAGPAETLAAEVKTETSTTPAGLGPVPELATSPTAVEALPEAPTFETTLASYSTRYHFDRSHAGRAHNVEQAATILNGAVIAPHETLSFNGHVGPRDRANGFRMAKVIDGGRLVPGMGGGVCQVASTLHAAALESGLEIVDARPHSRPSHYIPLGMDATVSYPQLDLVIENPFDFPILVESRAAEGEMYVEIVGQARPREVEIARRVLRRTHYRREIVEDPALPFGERVVEQRGIRGARVERLRTITEEGETRTEREIVRYPSTTEVVRVGTGPAPALELVQADGSVGQLALR